MRSPWLLLAFVAGCDGDPPIACATDDNCLAGQRCVSELCTATSSSTSDIDAAPSGDGGMMPDDGGVGIDAPPATCAPTCNGATPHCDDGTCVECITNAHCPLTAPLCRVGTCGL